MTERIRLILSIGVTLLVKWWLDFFPHPETLDFFVSMHTHIHVCVIYSRFIHIHMYACNDKRQKATVKVVGGWNLEMSQAGFELGLPAHKRHRARCWNTRTTLQVTSEMSNLHFVIALSVSTRLLGCKYLHCLDSAIYIYIYSSRYVFLQQDHEFSIQWGNTVNNNYLK